MPAVVERVTTTGVFRTVLAFTGRSAQRTLRVLAKSNAVNDSVECSSTTSSSLKKRPMSIARLFLVQVLTCFVSDDGDTEQASVDF